MKLIKLSNLLRRLDHRERSRSFVTALRAQIRNGRLDGFETNDTIEVPAGQGREPTRTNEIMLVDNDGLWEWFELMNASLKPADNRFRRPRVEDIESGRLTPEEIEEMINRTRSHYAQQSERRQSRSKGKQ